MLALLATSPQTTTYRNFNLCPHCIFQGRDSLLRRLCEGIPMISRSDGQSFHLLLADKPLPYPAERCAKKSKMVSICFWYSHIGSGSTTLTTVVLLTRGDSEYASFFRKIEHVADLLAAQLLERPQLPTLYKFDEHNLVEAMF
jgi:hypothetical protein